jgi:hypothetical protein
MVEYVHQELGTEVRSISGYYTIQEEGGLSYRDREVLYVVGGAVVDNSCCGSGGCRFIHIPGYVVSRKSRENEEGLSVSDVVPIYSADERAEIQKILDAAYPQSQIIFLNA